MQIDEQVSDLDGGSEQVGAQLKVDEAVGVRTANHRSRTEAEWIVDVHGSAFGERNEISVARGHLEHGPTGRCEAAAGPIVDVRARRELDEELMVADEEPAIEREEE